MGSVFYWLFLLTYYLPTYQWSAYKALMAKQKYIPDLLPPGTIVEVAKFDRITGEFIGLKVMSHGDFKKMEKQKGYRYQEYQKGLSSFNK